MLTTLKTWGALQQCAGQDGGGVVVSLCGEVAASGRQHTPLGSQQEVSFLAVAHTDGLTVLTLPCRARTPRRHR